VPGVLERLSLSVTTSECKKADYGLKTRHCVSHLGLPGCYLLSTSVTQAGSWDGGSSGSLNAELGSGEITEASEDSAKPQAARAGASEGRPIMKDWGLATACVSDKPVT
jgi:hypothetical protein